MRALRATSAAAALVAIVSAASSAEANPPDTYGFASRETAMGNAAAAETRGYAANYYNPAALVRSRGLAVGVSYFDASHSLAINGNDTGVDPVHGVNAGLVAPGKLLGIPFAFGLGIHLPNDRVSRVRALRQEQPRWELYDNRNQRLYLAVNAAIEPFPWLAIGGGLSFMSSTTGRLDISGSANVLMPEQSQLRHEVDADLTAVRYPQAGVRVKLSDEVAMALVYRGEFKLGLDLNAHLQGDISGITTALYDLHTQSVNNFLPQQVALGTSWRLTRDLHAAFDLTWIDWSAYVSPLASLAVLLDIPPPQGGWPLGITAPETPAPTRIAPLVMRDRVVPHLGAEWRALNLRHVEGFLRGGYELAMSPIEAQSGITNYVDRDRHTFSLGVGATLRGLTRVLPAGLSIDAHLAWSELFTRVTEKANAADFVGDYRAGGRILNIGATLSVAFDEPLVGGGGGR